MVLPHVHKKIRFVNIALVVLLLILSCQTVYSQEDRLGLNSIKSERYFNPGSGVFYSSKLAPTSMFGPIYKIQKSEDGKLSVIEPGPDQKESLYTEVVLALIAHSVDNGISEGPFEEFIERAIGGNDFQKCRIGSVQRAGSVFYALYLSKADPHDPDVMFLRFSAVPKDRIIDGSKAAVMQLPDGTGILIEAFPFTEIPKEYDLHDKERIETVHEVAELVLAGMPGPAVVRLFAGACFQDRRPDVFADICNRLIEKYPEDQASRGVIETFLTKVMHVSAELLDDGEFSRSVQLLAGQALTINSWRDGSLPGSEGLRVTAAAESMVSNDKHGKSYIDNKALPKDVVETKKEGTPGFFWRGAERIAKLGPNVVESLIYDKAGFASGKDRVVMYLMDHGFYKVDDLMREATAGGTVSTMHETFFTNDVLPGSFQTTSTGAGHFQETKVDLKRVTAGRGIQFNVRYSAAGVIEEVIAQELKEGDWALALPGYVDYMVNLGGLRFNDISITLSAADAAAFAPGFDFSKENLSRVKDAIAEKGKMAPYAGARIGDNAYCLKTRSDAPDARWIPSLANFGPALTLPDMYMTLSGEHVNGFVKGLQLSYSGTVSAPAPVPAVSPLRGDILAGAKGASSATLGRTEGIKEYITANAGMAAMIMYGRSSSDILLRVPVELVEAVGAEAVKPLLAELSSAPRVYMELFSSAGIGAISDVKYAQYGITKKALPADFVAGRQNTVTIMPMMKSEELSARGKSCGDWGIGDMRPTETIIAPVGLTNDRSGLIRGIILGLRLTEIARQIRKDGKPDEDFLDQTYEQYRSFCVSQGVKDFTFRMDDLVGLAAGNINRVVEALNRLIKSMPIMPINAEELRTIYEHAREALIRA